MVHNEPVLALFHRMVAAYGATSLVTKVAIILGVSLVASAFAVLVVVLLPADHFNRLPEEKRRSSRHPLLRWTLFGLKNLAGALILPMGVIMALPLIPGPGLVFILVGLSLLDFPGKRRLEEKLMTVPAVLHFLNEVRRRFRQPPLLLVPRKRGASAP